jgi:hypothetical protein
MRQDRYLEEVALRRETFYRWSEDRDHDHRESYGVAFIRPDNLYRTD